MLFVVDKHENAGSNPVINVKGLAEMQVLFHTFGKIQDFIGHLQPHLKESEFCPRTCPKTVFEIYFLF